MASGKVGEEGRGLSEGREGMEGWGLKAPGMNGQCWGKVYSEKGFPVRSIQAKAL